MPVIATIKFDDFIALGKTACETNGGHRCFGSGVAHPDFLYAWHQGANQFGDRNLERIRDAEAGAVLGGGLYGFDYFGMRMAEDGWTPRAYIIDVFVAIDIPNECALRSGYEKRLAAYGPKGAHGGVDPARDVFQSLGEKLFGFAPRTHASKVTTPGRNARGN